MDEEAILKKRVDDWLRLTQLSAKAESGFRKLTGTELLEFVRLYRRASADLSLLSTQTRNVEVIDYLNAIVTKVYGQLYRSKSGPLGQNLASSLVASAQVFRRSLWAFSLSLMLFFGSAIFTYGLLGSRPDLRDKFIPSGLEDVFSKWKEGKFDRREGGENIAMTAFYAQNNPSVGIMMNAASVASFGTMTAYVLWSNGSILGALASEMNSVGKLGYLLASIAPHGVSEIGGILVTGSGGFVLARALILPGRRRRSDALRDAGKDALLLLVTGLVMILIAAPIEGFFSFNPAVPIWAKVTFACMALSAWCVFFVGYGHETRSEPPHVAA